MHYDFPVGVLFFMALLCIATFLCAFLWQKIEVPSCLAVLEEEEVLLAEDTLSIHTDLADNEPVANEVRKQFLR